MPLSTRWLNNVFEELIMILALFIFAKNDSESADEGNNKTKQKYLAVM
ncbi:MAG: hypothetical protein ACQEXE_17995 [Bacillota bacterium]|nr:MULTISPECIES: hypothetical protein [Bacillaceae]MCC3649283.1 hypothetical protein [Cytobacillus oceanisediminis]MCS0655627.1 hypothetical protein [Cytobacillus firmus]MCU1807704.1 hypothetical protein [Cytobacillus firmus]WHY35085.1 hypothetical protein QNH44_04805 [Cytobacillus firmus]